MLIAFPPADSVPYEPAPPTLVIARSLGGIALNDRVHTIFDHLEMPGTRFLQVEQLQDRDGQVAVVRADRKGLVLTVYLTLEETPDLTWYQFVRALEDATAGGADLVTGDGYKYVGCYASEFVGTPGPVLSLGPPLLRVIKVSFKVTSTYTQRYAA